tara:strand:+ start:1228 stop:1428 length:201 start_codon:yes stop_codon:yes gene_type:complete
MRYVELPKFKKIEVLVEHDIDTTKLTFENAGFIIHGNSMVIEVSEGDTTVGSVYNLDAVQKYKTYK